MSRMFHFVVAVSLAVPALSFAHATISGLQPAPYKAAARTSYLIRVPNEKDKQNTLRVEVTIPEVAQSAISVKKVPGWKIKLQTQGSGETAKITGITYIATRAAEILPHFYEEFPVRMQNPATEQSVCFPILQVYRGVSGGTETVSWSGEPGSETPAPCLSIVP